LEECPDSNNLEAAKEEDEEENDSSEGGVDHQQDNSAASPIRSSEIVWTKSANYNSRASGDDSNLANSIYDGIRTPGESEEEKQEEEVLDGNATVGESFAPPKSASSNAFLSGVLENFQQPSFRPPSFAVQADKAVSDRGIRINFNPRVSFNVMMYIFSFVL
jgi:hypothetical protein